MFTYISAYIYTYSYKCERESDQYLIAQKQLVCWGQFSLSVKLVHYILVDLYLIS